MKTYLYYLYQSLALLLT